MRVGWVVLAVALAGCNQYWERKETVALGAGDAVASNIALQRVEPTRAHDTNIPTMGDKVERAIERYTCRGGPAPPTGAQTDTQVRVSGNTATASSTTTPTGGGC